MEKFGSVQGHGQFVYAEYYYVLFLYLSRRLSPHADGNLKLDILNCVLMQVFAQEVQEEEVVS